MYTTESSHGKGIIRAHAIGSSTIKKKLLFSVVCSHCHDGSLEGSNLYCGIQQLHAYFLRLWLRLWNLNSFGYLEDFLERVEREGDSCSVLGPGSRGDVSE